VRLISECRAGLLGQGWAALVPALGKELPRDCLTWLFDEVRKGLTSKIDQSEVL
jgi:hypothetical protein